MSVAIVCAGGWAYRIHMADIAVTTINDSQHRLTQISYHGHDDIDALTLLRQHAHVTVKHYSFGDLVVSIDGVAGNGPRYWTLYINGNMSMVGASSYKTASRDILAWKLQ